MKIFINLGLFLLALFSALSIFAQDFTELEKTVQDEMRQKNAVGAAVAIIKDGKTVFTKGFGTANAETNAPITSTTLFQVGSITKTFTAAMILGMADEGKIKLDAPVGDYVRNLSPKLSKVNLGQLLSHTGGIIDEPDEFGTSDESSMLPYIRSWTDDYVLFAPGEGFSYSNSGYALAGLTAQEAAGKSYVELMNEKVFAPLGMKSSTFRPTVAMTYPLAVGHTTKTGEKPQVVRPLPQDARLYPAGTFYSNLDDLSRFAIAFLEGGKLDGKQIIPASIIARMTAPHSVQLSASDDTKYGYGLFMHTIKGVKEFWHDGSMTGYVAQIKFIPERRFAVIILGNTNNVVLSKTQAKATEIGAGIQTEENYKIKDAMPMTGAEMRKYVGTYNQPNRWKIEIVIKDDKLFIKELGQELPLTKIGENRFSFQFPKASRPVEIYVQPSENGKNGFVHQYVWAFSKFL